MTNGLGGHLYSMSVICFSTYREASHLPSGGSVDYRDRFYDTYCFRYAEAR